MNCVTSEHGHYGSLLFRHPDQNYRRCPGTEALPSMGPDGEDFILLNYGRKIYSFQHTVFLR